MSRRSAAGGEQRVAAAVCSHEKERQPSGFLQYSFVPLNKLKFDKKEFTVDVGETAGEDIKYTRMIYTRKR